jgi:CMP-N,N'-diacetyllegionaminic acid synthase
MTRIVALIPARSGSKRVPNKNVKHLAGRPLIAYTIRAALDSGIFSRVVVSTDDPTYGDIARDYGASVMIPYRPAKYSTDTSPDIDWVRFTLDWLRMKVPGVDLGTYHDHTWKPEPPEWDDWYDAFAILRPTSPFRLASTIQRAWAEFQRHGEAIDSLRAVEKCGQHPYKMWLMQDDQIIPLMESQPDYFKHETPGHSRQYADLPPIYVQNASLEIAWVKTVRQKGSIAGDVIAPFFTENYEGFDVNHPLDWEMAEMLVAKGYAPLPPNAEIVYDSESYRRCKDGSIQHIDLAAAGWTDARLREREHRWLAEGAAEDAVAAAAKALGDTGKE